MKREIILLIISIHFISVSGWANGIFTANTDSLIVKSLYSKAPNCKISICLSTKKTKYFFQYENKPNGKVVIYNDQGRKITECSEKPPKNPLCSLEMSNEVVFVPIVNTWKIPAVDKFGISIEKKAIQKIYNNKQNTRIYYFKIGKSTYITQEENLKNAKIYVYDVKGNKLGVCKNWNNKKNKYCFDVNKGIVVYLPPNNVWGETPVNIFDLTDNIDKSKNSTLEKDIVQKLYDQMPDSRILKFKIEDKLFYSQEMNAEDAVTRIYDHAGNNIGICDYWNKRKNELCAKLKNPEILYMPPNNVWKAPPENKLNIMANQ
jgi:hypothetical protein